MAERRDHPSPAIAGELLEANRSHDGARVEELRAELAVLDPCGLEDDSERLAFWINLYNALVIEELRERPRRGNLLRHRRMFNTASYCVGGRDFSLNQIEHGLLRLNARPPAALRRTLRRGDPRLEAGPSALEPRIHFVLNCAATSCPPIRAYEPDQIEQQLALASRAYIQAETRIRHDAPAVWLPYLMKLYRKDFGEISEILRFAADHLSAPDAEWLRARIQARDARGGSELELGWSEYDWTLVH